jgi:hypothetical protein
MQRFAPGEATQDDVCRQKLVLKIANTDDDDEMTINLSEFRTLVALYQLPLVHRHWDTIPNRYFEDQLSHELMSTEDKVQMFNIDDLDDEANEEALM